MDANATTPAATNLDRTREAWLRVATDRMRPELEAVSGVKLPDIRVSMGFGGRRYEHNVAGMCYARRADAAGVNQIFISPEIGDMMRNKRGALVAIKGERPETGVIPATVIVLLALRHELIHAVLDNHGGHGIKANPAKGIVGDDRFPEYATRLGFDAPFAYLTPSPGLVDEMELLAVELGEFPHAQLNVKADVLVAAPTGGDTKTITSAGGSDVNRHLSHYCTDPTCPGSKSPIRMSAKKAARCVLVCIEMKTDGTPCLKPLKQGR